MVDLATLRDLRRRLREATGPDRELDAALMDLFYARDQRHIGVYDCDTNEPVLSDVWVDRDTGKFVAMGALDLTSSIDVEVSLIDRKLPQYGLLLNTGRKRSSAPSYCATIVFAMASEESPRVCEETHNANLALAACLALVSALIAIEEGKERAT